jgi:hypothetical protein
MPAESLEKKAFSVCGIALNPVSSNNKPTNFFIPFILDVKNHGPIKDKLFDVLMQEAAVFQKRQP